jgi:hypothetical protein
MVENTGKNGQNQFLSIEINQRIGQYEDVSARKMTGS